MTDTIDLLETLGKDASLRHASPQDLELALQHMHASDSLRRAAATGEPGHLKAELHPTENKSAHTPTPPPPGPGPGAPYALPAGMTLPPPPKRHS